MICFYCKKKPKMTWTTPDKKNGFSEPLWTSPKGKDICAFCLFDVYGKEAKGLHEIALERKQGQ